MKLHLVPLHRRECRHLYSTLAPSLSGWRNRTTMKEGGGDRCISKQVEEVGGRKVEVRGEDIFI